MKFFRNTLAALILVFGIFVLVLAPVAPAAAGCGGGYRYPRQAYYGESRAYPYVDYPSEYYRSYYPSVHIYGVHGYGYDGYWPSVPSYSYGLSGWGAATGYSSYCY